MNKKVSVIIPAKNEESYIKSGLSAISVAKSEFNKHYPNSAVEVILADNCSTDKTVEVCYGLVDKIITTDAHSIAGVRNAGAAAATGEILIFIDADSQMHYNTFVYIYELLANTDISAGCPEVLADCKLNYMWSFCLKLLNLYFKIINSGGGLYFCRVEDFKAIGGFNENLYAGEDLDFVKRIKKQLKTSGFRFKAVGSIPILTSMRKLKFIELRKILGKFIKYLIFGNKVLTKRAEWVDIWYNTETLR